MKIALSGILVAFMFLTTDLRNAESQNFSCSYGQPACLDYGTILCKSNSKCVARDAVVFDSYTCDYKGFVCKTQLDNFSDEYEKLRKNYNDLVDSSNRMQENLQNVLRNFEEAVRNVESAESQFAGYKRCVEMATSLPAAQACSSR